MGSTSPGMGTKRGRVPGWGTAPVQGSSRSRSSICPSCCLHVAPRSPASVCSLAPTLLFLRMLCSAVIAAKLFLVFRLTKGNVYL